jgi:hypothetical protein
MIRAMLHSLARWVARGAKMPAKTLVAPDETLQRVSETLAEIDKAREENAVAVDRLLTTLLREVTDTDAKKHHLNGNANGNGNGKTRR